MLHSVCTHTTQKLVTWGAPYVQTAVVWAYQAMVKAYRTSQRLQHCLVSTYASVHCPIPALMFVWEPHDSNAGLGYQVRSINLSSYGLGRDLLSIHVALSFCCFLPFWRAFYLAYISFLWNGPGGPGGPGGYTCLHLHKSCSIHAFAGVHFCHRRLHLGNKLHCELLAASH